MNPLAQRIQAALNLLYPDHITPIAKTMLQRIIEETEDNT